MILAADPVSSASLIDEADSVLDHDVRFVLRALLHRLHEAVEAQKWHHPERVQRGRTMARLMRMPFQGRPPSRENLRAGMILTCALVFTGRHADSLEESVAFDFLQDYAEWTMRKAPHVIVEVTGGILNK
ncbi:hypothetical protein [Gordonia hongkongensis]|uniref:hypothetical protein n=1 Tax=Gordonia hongkongensis TaxID=1701090 RepID=UPI003D70EDC5